MREPAATSPGIRSRAGRASRWRWAPLAVVFATFPLAAQERVSFRVELGGRGELRRAAVAGQLRAADARAGAVRVGPVVPVEGVASFEVGLPSAGDWVLDLEASGYLGETRTFPVHAGIDTDLGVVRLLPSATITGKIVLAPSERNPSEVLVRFGPAPGQGGDALAESGMSVCSLGGDGFRCPVPAGRLDFSVRVRGYASEFFWDRDGPHGQTVDLGSLRPVEGASVVGFVESSPGAPYDPKKTRVILEPGAWSGAGSKPWPPAPRKAGVGPRGFFHFVGVPPGPYSLRAQSPGFADDSREIAVLENSEANLKKPLRLDPPTTLELLHRPALDRNGGRWTVELLTQVEGTTVTSTRVVADAAGLGRFVRLRRGTRPEVRVTASNGDGWSRTEIALDAPLVRREIQLDQHAVAGRVRLGDRGVRGKLHFGGKHGVSLTSDEEGEFSGFLPRLGFWVVEVNGEEPAVRRTVVRKVEAGAGGSSGRLEIELGEGRIFGTVVGEDGEPPESAILRFRGSTPLDMTEEFTTDGRFEFPGLDPGKYTLSAETRDGESDETRVELGDSNDEEEITLVVRKRGKLRGRVVSSLGAGVPFATIQPLPFLPGSRQLPHRVTTDHSGAFEIALPDGVQAGKLVVFPPGFALRVADFERSGREPLVIPVDTVGGALTLRPRSGSTGWGNPTLRHRGAVFPLVLLDLAPGVEKVADGDGMRITVPLAEPGDYAMCPGDEASLQRLLAGGDVPTCASGTLSHRGELTLTVDPQK